MSSRSFRTAIRQASLAPTAAPNTGILDACRGGYSEPLNGIQEVDGSIFISGSTQYSGEALVVNRTQPRDRSLATRFVSGAAGSVIPGELSRLRMGKRTASTKNLCPLPSPIPSGLRSEPDRCANQGATGLSARSWVWRAEVSEGPTCAHGGPTWPEKPGAGVSGRILISEAVLGLPQRVARDRGTERCRTAVPSDALRDLFQSARPSRRKATTVSGISPDWKPLPWERAAD
jgi:hypothetical protein